MAENYLDKIRATYTEAVRQPPGETALPLWDELPLAMREAFVAVFFEGHRDAMRDAAERAQEEGS